MAECVCVDWQRRGGVGRGVAVVKCFMVWRGGGCGMAWKELLSDELV